MRLFVVEDFAFHFIWHAERKGIVRLKETTSKYKINPVVVYVEFPWKPVMYPSSWIEEKIVSLTESEDNNSRIVSRILNSVIVIHLICFIILVIIFVMMGYHLQWLLQVAIQIDIHALNYATSRSTLLAISIHLIFVAAFFLIPNINDCFLKRASLKRFY